MANCVCEVLVTEKPLENAAGTAAPPVQDVDASAGAIVDFWGVVRNLEGGREIEGIDYESHTPMAEHQLQLIAAASAQKFQLRKVIAHHRIGFVRAGEASLFLRVMAPHRAAAFEASKWIVDELKQKVPIWKKARFRSNAVASAVLAEKHGDALRTAHTTAREATTI
jgi:molybdopterin synthase catalytic subunit